MIYSDDFLAKADELHDDAAFDADAPPLPLPVIVARGTARIAEARANEVDRREWVRNRLALADHLEIEVRDLRATLEAYRGKEDRS